MSTSRSRRRRSSFTSAGVAPFCGANTSAASQKRVRTSQATTSSTPRSRCPGSSARSAPNPPSVVADPPTHTMILRASRSRAASISSPVP